VLKQIRRQQKSQCLFQCIPFFTRKGDFKSKKRSFYFLTLSMVQSVRHACTLRRLSCILYVAKICLRISEYPIANIFNFQGAAALSGTPLAGLIVELSGQKQVRKFPAKLIKDIQRKSARNIQLGI
jgi:hypothetical protein